jgi:hypothetical protein
MYKCQILYRLLVHCAVYVRSVSEPESGSDTLPNGRRKIKRIFMCQKLGRSKDNLFFLTEQHGRSEIVIILHYCKPLVGDRIQNRIWIQKHYVRSGPGSTWPTDGSEPRTGFRSLSFMSDPDPDPHDLNNYRPTRRTMCPSLCPRLSEPS